jgi:hypothetical protein
MTISTLDAILHQLQPIPSLSALDPLFEDSGLMALFLGLVDEYLPEKKGDILSHRSNEDKVGAFFGHFNNEYFEIDDGWCQSIYENGDEDEDGHFTSIFEGLVRYLPLVVAGFDEYHDFLNLKLGCQMMLAVLECPPELLPCHSGTMSGANADPRLPIIREMEKKLGPEVTCRIPQGGLSFRKIRALTKGSKYAGLADWADYVNHETGCSVLDLTTDDEHEFSWDRALVNRLKKEDKPAKEKEARYLKLANWLEENPRKNFTELLDFLLKPQTKTLMEVFNGKA